MNAPELFTGYLALGVHPTEIAWTHGMGRQRSGHRARRSQSMVLIAN